MSGPIFCRSIRTDGAASRRWHMSRGAKVICAVSVDWTRNTRSEVCGQNRTDWSNAVNKRFSAWPRMRIIWTARGVGSMPWDVRTNRGSSKYFRSLAKLMLMADCVSLQPFRHLRYAAGAVEFLNDGQKPEIKITQALAPATVKIIPYRRARSRSQRFDHVSTSPKHGQSDKQFFGFY